MAQNVDNANQRMGIEMDKVINDLQNSKTED
jgi:NAD-dependent SIR2 family protein deacetylase